MSNTARRHRRTLAGMLAAALALSVTPILGFAGVASAQEVADPTGEGNFCEDVPQTEPFTDVQTTDPSYGEIVCLVATEITTGVTATTYEPNSFVTRRQMALFLVRLANEANRLEVGDSINELPAPADTDFSDTEDEEQFIEDAISQITQAGVAEGFPDGTYRPAAPVSRRQMAAFIDRLYEFLTGTALPDSATDHFADDNNDSAEAQASTNAVAEAGIFIGNEDGTFRPAQEITRRQMANVLTRTLQVLFENGEITQWVSGDADNQTFTLGGRESRDVIANPAAPQTSELRTCTVTGIPTGSVVDARVIPTEDVTIGADGRVTFLDTAAPLSQYDETVAANAVIVNVNGANVTPAQEVNNIVATIGAISVTFGSATVPDDLTLLVWTDADGLTANVLDLEVVAGTGRKAPREAFGVGCSTNFINEAASGPIGATLVASVDKTADVFSTDTGSSYFYDSNDVFQLGAGCDPSTMAAFEARISPDDGISGSYGADPASVSTFCLDDTNPMAPATANATASGTSTIVVEFDESDTPTTDAYNVYRVVRPAGSADCDVNPNFNSAPGRAAFTLIGTVADPSTTTDTNALLSFSDTGLAASTTYCYAVTAVDDGDESNLGTTDEEMTGSTGETVRPTSVDAELTTSGGLANRLDAGDVLKACFSEAMRAPDAGDQVEVTDADGDVALLTNGGNATFALGAAPDTQVGTNDADDAANPCAANRTLIITITGAVTDSGSAAVGDNIVQVPVDATDSSGVTDLAGNTWDILGSPDVFFDLAPANADDVE